MLNIESIFLGSIALHFVFVVLMPGHVSGYNH